MHSACVRLEHCRRAESNGRERGKGGAACSVGYMEAVEAEVPKQVEQNQQPRLGDISLCRLDGYPMAVPPPKDRSV